VAHLYYIPEGTVLEPGATAVLVGDEARHAVSVGRLGVGEEILIGDGRGVLARAHATQVSAQKVELQVHECTSHEPPSPQVWLVQALAKGDRDEMAIQTCTELGVDRVIPWQAARSVSVWKGDKLDKGVARWQKIVTEASKQSLRARIPEVSPAMSSCEVALLGETTQLILLDPEAEDSLSAYRPPVGKTLVLLVGPEGGVESSERQMFLDAGAIDLKLGDTVLRTSSAGPAALAVLNSALGRW
jgi:16S rRNA (uracil1498-N3)-methyltransferase